MAEPLDTRPDSLISSGNRRLVCEIGQFDLEAIDEKLSVMTTGVLSDKDVYGRARFALVEKAQQLAPLAGCGLPLVIVLSNPHAVFVPLDPSHMISVMFGNPKWSIPIDATGGGPAGSASFMVEDYGAFVSLLRDEQDERLVWPHPHVSAVATLHQRTNEQDFIYDLMVRHPAQDGSLDAAAHAAFAAFEEIDVARREGLIPRVPINGSRSTSSLARRLSP